MKDETKTKKREKKTNTRRSQIQTKKMITDILKVK